MLKNISYLMISTNNKERLVSLYQKILGLELINPSDPISSLSFPDGGAVIGFIEKSDDLPQNKRIEITNHVDSVKNSIAELETKGVVFWRGFTKVVEGMHVANFRDPDENELSLLSFGED
jgi:predicted enzyme related to lactoylglutathione lyase